MKNDNQPATRSDLMALKSDLTALKSATRSNLRALKSDLMALKSDLKAAEGRLAREILGTQAQVRRIEETMMTKADGERILAKFDYLMGKDRDNDRTVLVFDQMLREHNQRIKRLEGLAQP